MMFQNFKSGEVFIEVPNDYRGLVRIYENGNALSNSRTEWIEVDSSGEAEVPSLGDFRKWHRVHARYADGTPLRYMNDGATGGTAIWPLTLKGEDNIAYFVGTEDQWESIRADGFKTNVLITVPADFRGVFAIKENSSSSIDIGGTSETVEIAIPPSGEIDLKSTRFLETWHSTTVRTEDGVEFPNGMLKQDETLSFYYLWTNTEGTTYFLIGDHDAYLAAQKIGRVEPLQKFD